MPAHNIKGSLKAALFYSTAANALVAPFKRHDRFSDDRASPFGSAIAVATRQVVQERLVIRLDQVMLYFVHPESVAVVQFDPSRFKPYIDYHELHFAGPQ